MPHSFSSASPAAMAAPQAPPLRLALHRVNGKRVRGEAVPLPEEGAVLGSAPVGEALGLQLDASLHVARNHARILPLCGHWMLSLADESMVCAVNGSKVVWGELCTLAPGDSIQMGFTEVRVESAEDSRADAALWGVATLHSAPVQSDILPVVDSSASLAESVENSDAVHRTVLPDIFADGDARAESADPDGDAGLSPEAALLQQLDTDFAASLTSRALFYHTGQPLDAILAPVGISPSLAGLVSFASEDAPATSPVTAHPAQHLPQAPPQATPQARPLAPSLTSEPAPACPADEFSPPIFAAPVFTASPATATATPSDQDFFAQLAQPRGHSDLLPSPSTSANEAVPADPLPSLAELLHAPDSALSLEDIVDGPLHIDDVLRGLEQAAPDASPSFVSASATEDAALPFTLDVLQQEIPPDPLTLLDNPGQATLAASVWDSPTSPPSSTSSPNSLGSTSSPSPLSPLLRREHHQSGLHSPYTLPRAGKSLKDKESA